MQVPIGTVEMIVLPGSHHLHMERPAEVAAAIGDFLVSMSHAGERRA